jgi:hypothetical protein
MARDNAKRLTWAANVVVELHKDGTYRIVKDTTANFEPRDEKVYGFRRIELINIPKPVVMAGRMTPGGVFKGKRI